jgi:hypothetical protein
MNGETVEATLDEKELARVDAVAARWALTREQMLARLVRLGLRRCEREARAATNSMQVTVVDRLVLVVHGTAEPTADEWETFLSLVEHHGIARTMMLVLTEGHGPSTEQIQELDALLADRVPIAVLSSSLRVRMGLAPLSSWSRRRVRTFGLSGLYDALVYLEVPLNRRELLERKVEELRANVRHQ